MKVAILAPEFIPTWGGVGIYTVELVKELAKSMEVHVITPCRGLGEEEVLRQLGANVTIHQISNASDTFFYNFKFQVALKRKFAKLHTRYGFDLVHSMNLVHMPDLYLDFNKMGIPHVVTVHTTIQTQMEGIKASKESIFKLSTVEKCTYLAYPYIACMQRLYLKKTKHIIAVSHMMKKKLEDYGFKGDITVIHNGIGKDKFEKPTKFEYKLPKKKNILYVGRLLHQKGIDVFVRLMAELTDDDYHFVICGQGGDFDKLIKKYNIPASRYTYLGYVPNQKLKQVYAQAYALVLPSYFENLPITLLEAMAQGVPCIATDVGGVGEIIEDGKTGYLVENGDVEGIRKRIKELTRKYNTIQMAGIIFIKKRFTSASMGKQTISAYNNIVAH